MKFSRHFFISCTISNASPAVVTAVEHELFVDDEIWFETTGALPAGLTVDTTYYVINNGITANIFQVSASQRGAAINTTDVGSGSHTFQKQNRARLTPAYHDNR